MKAIIAVGVVVVVAVAVVLITSGGEATADEVRFENVSDPGSKPFTTPTDVPKSSAESRTSSGAGAGAGSGAGSSAGSPSSSAGTPSGSSSPSTPSPSPGASAPGVAGAATGSKSAASGEPTVCDREKLVAELVADPDKLSPWAGAVGIESDPQSVAAYIRKLNPVTLTRDTQVTDHFYDNGDAKSFQAILPQGTAVLAEDDGTPVARCRAGSPLSEPVKLETKTKCVNCPANFQPPPACDGKCFKPEPGAPPAKAPNAPILAKTDPIATAKTELEKCRKDKGGLEQCKTEYEKARKGCGGNPLNPLCDSSVCFDALTDGQSRAACASYLDRGDTLGICLKLETAQKQACLKRLDDLRAKCAAKPATPDCIVNPKDKAFRLRRQCTVGNGAQPECKAVQVACAKTKEFGCEELQNTCLTVPDRPDCKAVSDLKQGCAKDPKQPDCQGVTGPQGAQGLQQQEPPVVPGDELVPPDQGAPPDNGGAGGGQAPPAGEGQQPQQAPPPEGATP